MVGKVRRSAYRQPVTANGLRKIEHGELEWFDTEMFANFNTGVLEQYLEEKNRREGFQAGIWDWKKILGIGLTLGCLFALINQYVGLKVGMVVAGSMYIIFLLGMAQKWEPQTINIVSTVGNGASLICTGFVFSFPAIYILAFTPEGILPEEGINVIQAPPGSLILLAMIASFLAGILGILYFIIFRRIWLIEDPILLPGFEANVKLMDMARQVTGEAAVQAKRSVRLTLFWLSGTAFFTFLTNFPINDRGPIFDNIFGGKYYSEGTIMQPMESATYTHLSIGLVPIQFGLGWFMKFRVALLIFLGTAFAWFVVIPLAVALHAPMYDPVVAVARGSATAGFVDVNLYPLPENIAYAMMPENPPWAAYNIARIMAIGVILGGGFTALFKMLPVFKTVFKDLSKVRGGKKGEAGAKAGSYTPGKGWYDWPASHIKLMIILTFFAVGILFSVGFPEGGINAWVRGFIFAGMLVGFTFILGAIAVKVYGETGTEPVSATSFIVLLILIIVIGYLMRTPIGLTVMMGLLGVTVFGSAISMSGDIIWNFKTGLYCGNRPYHIVRASTLGIIPGAIISAAIAALLSYGLAIGKLPLAAPQAHAFSLFTMIMVTGQVDAWIFGLGILLGVFLELLIGMGTAFGLGMYLPLYLQFPMLFGGAARDAWEKYVLEPNAKKYNWTEKQKSIKLLESYLMATGLIVGEALIGTIIAIYIVIPNLPELVGG
ncbi:OPT/YSL family transporter [[Eubacterium] cellulosolvens]